MTKETTDRLPEPATPPPEGELAHGLTFFLTARQRRAVLAQLRRLSRGPFKKEDALIRALGVDAQVDVDAKKNLP